MDGIRKPSSCLPRRNHFSLVASAVDVHRTAVVTVDANQTGTEVSESIASRTPHLLTIFLLSISNTIIRARTRRSPIFDMMRGVSVDYNMYSPQVDSPSL